jgi:hypothetical protein
LHNCGLQTLTVKAGHSLPSLDNKFLRRMRVLKRKKLKESYEYCIMVLFVMLVIQKFINSQMKAVRYYQRAEGV